MHVTPEVVRQYLTGAKQVVALASGLASFTRTTVDDDICAFAAKVVAFAESRLADPGTVAALDWLIHLFDGSADEIHLKLTTAMRAMP